MSTLDSLKRKGTLTTKGSTPMPVRRSTKEKRVAYGTEKMQKAFQRREARKAKRAELAKAAKAGPSTAKAVSKA